MVVMECWKWGGLFGVEKIQHVEWRGSGGHIKHLAKCYWLLWFFKFLSNHNYLGSVIS